MKAPGKIDALGGGVGDVALVPEGNVFHACEGEAAQDAGEAADALALVGVALVGHGGGALLGGAEGLFDFADFGAGEVADLGGELVERGGEEGEGVEDGGVAVALHDLGGDGVGGEAEALEGVVFDFGGDVGVGADRAGDFACGDVVAWRLRGGGGGGLSRRTRRAP